MLNDLTCYLLFGKNLSLVISFPKQIKNDNHVLGFGTVLIIN